VRFATNLCLLASLAILLCACATDNRALQQVMTNAKGITVKQSCCTSLREAVGTPASLSDPLVVFGPESRHYDFGNGVAPFASFLLPEGAKVLEAEGPRQLVGWAYGGDGTSRYVTVQALFFDAQGRQLDGKLLDRAQRITAPGARSLFHYFGIPEGAAYVVVTTDPSKHEVMESSRVKNAPDIAVVSSSPVFFIPGDLLPDFYRLANYGPVLVRVLNR
jgi:hypothetical protein